MSGQHSSVQGHVPNVSNEANWVAVRDSSEGDQHPQRDEQPRVPAVCLDLSFPQPLSPIVIEFKHLLKTKMCGALGYRITEVSVITSLIFPRFVHI